jgi:menaquinone-9 beta-reductase
MRIGIVGARLAGSYAAWILAHMGHDVLMFDPTPQSEKPCGGGMTPKPLDAASFFRELQIPEMEVKTLRLDTSCGRSASISLGQPMRVFSRATLDAALREASIGAGARLLRERVRRLTPRGPAWSLDTAAGSSHLVDFLIGADGVNSTVRFAVGQPSAPDDFSLALGYYLYGLHPPHQAVIMFQEGGFRGYLWSFPGLDHVSLGIVQRLPGVRAADLRARVESFMRLQFPDVSCVQTRYFASRVPCFSPGTFSRQRTCGGNWALLGDAAGFVDPITSEGIHFALRSAEILGEAIAAADPLSYEERWRSDFGRDLALAADWRDGFYGKRFLGRPFTELMVQVMSRSAIVRHTAESLMSGKVPYRALRGHLLRNCPRILSEILREAVTHQAVR